MIRALLNRLLRGRVIDLPPGNTIERLEVSGLTMLRGERGSRIRYSFSLELERPAGVLAFNRGLRASIEGGSWRYRKTVEKGLGWATVNTAYRRVGFREAEGMLEGFVEDFTLSMYGTRGNRAVLKDETLWHPVPSDNLVAWGLRGRLGFYSYSASLEAGLALVGPGYEEDEGVFRGRSTHRSPGLSLVIGRFRRIRLPRVEFWVRSGAVARREAAAAWDNIESLATVFEDAGAPLGVIDRVVEVWDETDPFAQDNMIALRSQVFKGAAKGEGPALYEVLVTLGSRAFADSAPRDLGAYWVYENLPEAAAIAASLSIGGPLEEVLRSRAMQLRECLETGVKGGYRIFGVGMPRSHRQRVIIRCGVPLAFYRLATENSPEALWDIVKCIGGKGVYSEEDAVECVVKVLGEEAGEIFTGENKPGKKQI
ncbi:hypothetical protein [Aeropyrum camini]|uniref:Uncharacterized protein n=1 Tax=Aeropyrum camini SY1 = JCM 12091 TaxID=1198449 RepID=U3TCS6_9CREN|nr:hypothetical protein [Aeropyrum camini]BAN89845.1 hypothetical protein ACAM_0376 [Aeropyrum camini SY1 = JCM 12091]